MIAPKTYLGDGVYGEIGDFSLRLTTETGVTVDNTIHLEPEVIKNLLAYLRSTPWKELL